MTKLATAVVQQVFPITQKPRFFWAQFHVLFALENQVCTCPSQADRRGRTVKPSGGQIAKTFEGKRRRLAEEATLWQYVPPGVFSLFVKRESC